MTKAFEHTLQFFALGIFAVAALFCLPFWVFSMFFLQGDETHVATPPGVPMRLLYSEAVWGCIALVAWVSLVTVLLKT